jgi:hypothetical protein
MDVHRVSWVSPFWKRFQVVCGEPNGACHSRVNVIALLKVNVFKEVATDFANRNRIAIHIDSCQSRDCALHGHQSSSEIFVDAGF